MHKISSTTEVEKPTSGSFLKMDGESFERLSTYVTRTYGIKLPHSKKDMLEGRLGKKAKSIGATSYKEFVDFIFSDQGRAYELQNVIDLITTNKTDFFRESGHFQFLCNEFLPAYPQNNIKIWSAGCSSGEEPYTIVMSMEEYKKQHPAMAYQLLASDVSTRAVKAAYQGIYDIGRIAPVPHELRRLYFLRGKHDMSKVRVKPQYRKKVQFRRINFMDGHYGIPKAGFDIVFCRNVLIYFDKATQERVINNLCSHLKPGGVLFLGHSESIIGMSLPLTQMRPTIYRYDG